jgi:hypothetical protein
MTTKRLLAPLLSIFTAISGCNTSPLADAEATGDSTAAESPVGGGPADGAIAAQNAPASGLYEQLPPDGGKTESVGTIRGDFHVTDDGVATYSLPLAERVNKFEASWFGVQWMTGVG